MLLPVALPFRSSSRFPRRRASRPKVGYAAIQIGDLFGEPIALIQQVTERRADVFRNLCHDRTVLLPRGFVSTGSLAAAFVGRHRFLGHATPPRHTAPAVGSTSYTQT